METTAVRQFLESLCSNSTWSYAVFWKLQHVQGQMLLIYEDGYCYYNVSELRSQSILGQYSGQERILNLGFLTNLLDGNLPDDPSVLATDDIPCRQYVLGQGLVGSVALSGNDLWLYSDETESIELMSCLENPDEWLLPVAAGIKTTLVAPVFPYGVLQLGSFEKVAENAPNVADIKDGIIALKCTPTSMPSPIRMSEWENMDESSFSIIRRTHSQDAKEFHVSEFADIEISTVYEGIDQFQLEDTTINSLLASDMDIPHMYLDLSIEPDVLNEFSIPDIPETLESLWAYCCHDDEYITTGISSETSSGLSSNMLLEQEKQSLAVEHDGESDLKILASLQEVLEPTFSVENDGQSRCSYEAEVDSCEDLKVSAKSLREWFDEGGDQDYLLEAAIAALYRNSDDSPAYMSNNSRSSVNSLAEYAPSRKVHVSYENATAQTDRDTSVSPRQSTSFSGHQSPPTNTLTSGSSDSFASAKVEVRQPRECEYEFFHTDVKMPKLSKGRAGLKNHLKPRPRDRQLIQDRLKQLRKLVPSGAKSSIDGLLEHTTKHMMFLRGVTEQAKKVKQFTDQKVNPERNETNTRRPSHASLSQQGGDNSEPCPIIVTDLEHPGQFLIQMLCKSDEVFFEMIEVIRQLNLSILQGVMEAHCSNRARFIVEASENFNRLDIFWPLMRILQRNGDWMTKMNQWCV